MKKLIKEYKEVIKEKCYNGGEILKEELANLDREFNRKGGEQIDVNDYGVCRITDEQVVAHLVIEEDGRGVEDGKSRRLL